MLKLYELLRKTFKRLSYVKSIENPGNWKTLHSLSLLLLEQELNRLSYKFHAESQQCHTNFVDLKTWFFTNYYHFKIESFKIFQIYQIENSILICIVKKKDGCIKFCKNYEKLNIILSFLSVKMDDIFD